MSHKTRLDALERRYNNTPYNPLANMTDEEIEELARQEPTIEELTNLPDYGKAILEAEFGEGYVERRLREANL